MSKARWCIVAGIALAAMVLLGILTPEEARRFASTLLGGVQ